MDHPQLSPLRFRQVQLAAEQRRGFLPDRTGTLQLSLVQKGHRLQRPGATIQLRPELRADDLQPIGAHRHPL